MCSATRLLGKKDSDVIILSPSTKVNWSCEGMGHLIQWIFILPAQSWSWKRSNPHRLCLVGEHLGRHRIGLSAYALPLTPLGSNLSILPQRTPGTHADVYNNCLCFPFLINNARLLKLLCCTNCYHLVQTWISDSNILIHPPFLLFMISRGNSCPRVQPTLLSATNFTGSLSSQSAVVASVIAHTWSVISTCTAGP